VPAAHFGGNGESPDHAGVKLYERQGVLLHSKTALIDGVWSCVGSTNLDWRSFVDNDEINAVILGREFAQQMQAMFSLDLEVSEAIDRERWEGRALTLRLKECGAGLLQRLLWRRLRRPSSCAPDMARIASLFLRSAWLQPAQCCRSGIQPQGKVWAGKGRLKWKP